MGARKQNEMLMTHYVLIDDLEAFLRPYRGAIFCYMLPRVPLMLHPGLLTVPPTGGRTQFT